MIGEAPVAAEQQAYEQLIKISVLLARTDTADGFYAFYHLVTGNVCPPHAKKWVREMYTARAQQRGTIVEAFRGSTKTTTLTQMFVAHQIGLHPDLTNLIIQASDNAASNNTSRIADIIKDNPSWKVIFPWVVPDTAQGWGASGYEVKDTRKDYGEFRKYRTQDPTLLGLGYKSNEIVGKHPSGVLLIDDIINNETAASSLELSRVFVIYSDHILPTRKPNRPWLLLVGTPWNKVDLIAKAKESGEYLLCRTPVYVMVGKGEPGGVWYPQIKQFVRFAWPEVWNAVECEREKRLDLTGGAGYDRSYLLDLTGNRRRSITYMPYPSDQIDFSWPFQGGCDPAGIEDPTRRGDGQHSHFAHAHVAKTPTGGAVVAGGTLELCSLAEGLDYLQQAQDLYSVWLNTVVEGDGIGEAFMQMIRLKPRLRLQMLKTANKSKADRIVNSVGPWVRNGRVKISDADTPFLNTLRIFADNYPNVSQHDPGWDAWDSVYWALRGIPDILVVAESRDNLTVAGAHTRRTPNPFSSLSKATQ